MTYRRRLEAAFVEGAAQYSQYKYDLASVRGVFTSVRDFLWDQDIVASVEETDGRMILKAEDVTLAALNVGVPIFPGTLSVPALGGVECQVLRLEDLQEAFLFVLRSAEVQTFDDDANR